MTNEIDQKIINALKTVFDPEIPVDIYELGLIYKCEVTPDNNVLIALKTLRLSLDNIGIKNICFIHLSFFSEVLSSFFIHFQREGPCFFVSRGVNRVFKS